MGWEASDDFLTETGSQPPPKSGRGFSSGRRSGPATRRGGVGLQLDLRLAVPQAQRAEGADEGVDILLAGQRHDARVRLHAGLVEQRLCRGAVADELAVLEGVGDEVARRRMLQQCPCPRLRRQHCDCVVEHGRAAIDHLLGLDPAAVARLHAADRGRDDLGQRAGLGHGRLQRLQQRGVGAVGHQDAELAAFEALGSVLDDAERGRGLQVLARRHRGLRRVRQLLQAEALRDLVREFVVDVEQVRDHALADHRRLHLAELEGQRGDDVVLLGPGLADEELPRLAVMIGEGFAAHALLDAVHRLGERAVAALGRFARPLAPGVRLVVHAALRIAHRHVAVLLEMRERALGRVDRQVREVGAAQPLYLGVEIGEVAALQQRIVGEVDAGRHVLGHERDLLGLGKEVVRHAVQHQAADRHRLQHFLRNELGGIEDVEVELVGEGLVEQLQAAAPIPGSCRSGSPATGRGGDSPDRRR